MPLLLSACAVSSISSPFKSSDEELQPLPPSQNGMLRLLTIYAGGEVGNTQAIMHRGEITKLSRQCQIYGDRVTVKYGFAGRVLLGPKGKPGEVTMPISIKVADADRKVLANDKASVSTIVPTENPVGYFSMVKEITFPMTMGMRPEDYKVFVAFERTQAGAG